MKNCVQVIRKVNSPRQIVMFPFGGGSGYSYMPLVQDIPRDTEVILINPPGHLMNSGKAFESIGAMVYAYCRELRPLLKETALIFGHSIGGVVAYEICKELKNFIPIKRMVISSVNPPHLTSNALDLRSDMETEALIEKSTQLGGMPRIFQQEPALLEGFIDGLRADLKALELYDTEDHTVSLEKLSTSATVLYSDKDYIIHPEELKEWERYLECSEYISFPGDHFYLFEENNRKKVARILTSQVDLLTGKRYS